MGDHARSWGLMGFYSGLMGFIVIQWDINGIPSGEHLRSNGKIHHFSWENPLFLWPFSIAMLVITRGYQ